MEILFSLIFFLAGFAAFIFFIIMIANFIKKDKVKGKKNLVRMASSILTSFVALVIFIIIIEPAEENTSDDKEQVETAKVKEDLNKESEADKAAKAKSEAEAQKKAEADKKAAEAEKLVKEKEYYINEVKTKLDTQMKMYDSAWNELWVPTFEGIGTTIDIYTAYGNMQMLEQRYDTLYSSFPAIEGNKLSKENQKLLKDVTGGMRDASMWRGEAAEKAQKMFDEGDYSPSKMDKMKNDIQYADNQMMQAAIALAQLEISLGIEEEN